MEKQEIHANRAVNRHGRRFEIFAVVKIIYVCHINEYEGIDSTFQARDEAFGLLNRKIYFFFYIFSNYQILIG